MLLEEVQLEKKVSTIGVFLPMFWLLAGCGQSEGPASIEEKNADPTPSTVENGPESDGSAQELNAGNTGDSSSPILFVHGFNGDGSHWHKMIEHLKNAGWPAEYLYNWSYDWTQSNQIIAQQIKEKVEAIKKETGATKVNIVTHSMGGLSSRWYIKFLGGTESVAKWVSIAGPNHGTNVSYLCFMFVSCQEMNVHSSFLSTLNGGDETPGPVQYGTWSSPCDEAINPTDSVKLAGAINNTTKCLEHILMLNDLQVATCIKNFLLEKN